MDYIGVFQGGGVKGIGHAGAIFALEERGFRCVQASGTSVGAIIASLVVAGYRGEELRDIIKDLDISSLRQKSDPTVKAFRNRGIFDSTPLYEKLEALLAVKGIKTFLDVKVGTDYRLKIIATETRRFSAIVIPDDLPRYGIDPDNFSVAKAVVMSASYPVFYKPLKLDNTYILDGGIRNNFPFYLFENADKLVIGFNLEKETGTKLAKKHQYVIKIPTLGVKTMNFKISEEKKNELFESGVKAAKKFINQYFYDQLQEDQDL